MLKPMSEPLPISITVSSENAGKRLDQFLAAQLTGMSRARVQQLIAQHMVRVNDSDSTARPSLRLRGGERIAVLGPASPPPLRAMAEDIPLNIVFEDADLAVVNKPAGMMVHAGAGATEDQRNRGTLVNALLHHFGQLSTVGGELRPGIVHRLDKATSGLIVVAKSDDAHRRLASQFVRRQVKKKYLALVQGWLKQDRGTIHSSISRDRVRRTRMTTRRPGGREAITHYTVQRRLDSPYRKVHACWRCRSIPGGRTRFACIWHRSATRWWAIRYTALPANSVPGKVPASLCARNFLHAAALQFQHPRTGAPLAFSAPLPAELSDFLQRLGA